MILAHDFISKAGTQAPTLVLIHAFPLNRNMWKAQAEALAGEANLLLVDLRGFGESDATEHDGWSVKMWATDVLETMDHLGVERAAFAGCSMGGYVIFEVLRQARNRVTGIALVDTRGEGDTPQALDGRKAQIERLRKEGNGVLVEWAVDKLVGETTKSNNPDIAERVRAMAQSTPVETMIAGLGALGGREESMELLKGVDVPAVVIVGAEDVVSPPDVGERMKNAIPAATLVVVEGAGHLTPMEAPEKVNGALRSILAR